MNKQNLSKLECSALQFLMKNKKKVFIMNESDKNLGAAAAKKKDVITECTRQLYDINTSIIHGGSGNAYCKKLNGSFRGGKRI